MLHGKNLRCLWVFLSSVSPSRNAEDKSVIVQPRQIPSEILKCAITKAIWWLRGALGGINTTDMTTMIVSTDMIAGMNNGVLLFFYISKIIPHRNRSGVYSRNQFDA